MLDLLRETDKLRSAADSALAQIRVKLADAERRLEQARLEAAVAGKRLAVVNEQLKKATAELGEQKKVLAERAAHIYIVGPQGYLPYVFGAKDVNDAMAASVYGERILRVDSDAVNKFRAAAAIVKTKRDEAAALKRKIDANVAATDLERKALQDLKDRQEYLRQSVFATMGSRAAALSKMFKNGNPFAAILASFSNTGTGFAELIRAAQKGQDPARFKEEWLERPIPGRITGDFGWRTHPIYGYLSFHTGVDMSAEYGEPIYPAADGRIIDVGYFGPFGMTVLIDHGGSVATIYSHMSRIDVGPGDEVTVDSVIGAIGSTGWSTGPHLHFEVRAGGNPIEPIEWLGVWKPRPIG